MGRSWGVAALVLALAGCDVGSDSQPDESAWTFVGEFAYAPDDGELLTAVVELPEGAEGFAVFAEVDGCAQVALLEDDASTWVAALESGPSCAGCAERFSVIAETGLLVHVPDSPRSGSARLRLGKIECDTLTRARPGPDAPADASQSGVRLWVRELPAVPSEAVVPLRFVHGPHSSQASSADSEALVAAVSALLAPAGVRVALDSASFDETLPATTRWYEGDTSELEVHVNPDDEVVDVVFGGCLEHVHPELGTRTILDGFVPRVTTQGAAGGGVFLRGRECSELSPERSPVAIDLQARRLAHELGHYLGLYHAGDNDEPNNLMVPNPSVVFDPILNPAQAERMRLHAALLLEPTPEH